MAQLFVAAPLYIRAAALGMQAVDCDLKKPPRSMALTAGRFFITS